MCRKLALLGASHCPSFEDIDTGPACLEQYARTSLLADHSYGKAVEQCIDRLDACADVTACADAAAHDQPLRACNDKSETTLGQAVGLPHDEWWERTLRHAARFSEIRSSKAEPVEVCGIPTENDWLAALHCDDGSSPFRDASPETVRGNVGAGGHCASIIDLYRVNCPEATYDIYLDGYVCPAPPTPP
jgi:hypothetical protein